MRRIYIDAPELETVVHGYGWVQRKSMSGALKLASLFLGSMSFVHRFYEIAKAKDGVFEAMMKARKGENVSLDSLSEAARDWLGRRGFKTTEDINEPVTIGGGSLGQPLHTLYCVLRFVCSRIPQNQPLATWKRPNITFGEGPLFSKRYCESLVSKDRRRARETAYSDTTSSYFYAGSSRSKANIRDFGRYGAAYSH